jgi:hypothetical protein
VLQFADQTVQSILYPVPHRQSVFTIPRMLRVYFPQNRRLLCPLCRCAGTNSGVKSAFHSDVFPQESNVDLPPAFEQKFGSQPVLVTVFGDEGSEFAQVEIQ